MPLDILTEIKKSLTFNRLVHKVLAVPLGNTTADRFSKAE